MPDVQRNARKEIRPWIRTPNKTELAKIVRKSWVNDDFSTITLIGMYSSKPVTVPGE